MKTNIPHYSGWQPRTLRTGRGSSETGPRREAKRSRLGSTADRALYKSAKGHKANKGRYVQLCDRADSLNKRQKT